MKTPPGCDTTTGTLMKRAIGVALLVLGLATVVGSASGRVSSPQQSPVPSQTPAPSKDTDEGIPISNDTVVNVCGELVAVAVTTHRGNVRIVPLDIALEAMHVTPADLR